MYRCIHGAWFNAARSRFRQCGACVDILRAAGGFSDEEADRVLEQAGVFGEGVTIVKYSADEDLDPQPTLPPNRPASENENEIDKLEFHLNIHPRGKPGAIAVKESDLSGDEGYQDINRTQTGVERVNECRYDCEPALA